MKIRPQRPRISLIDFFSRQEGELAFIVARAFSDHVHQAPNALLTNSHVAITAWSAITIDVPNGGFTQFFFNRGSDHGISELTALLDDLELNKVATLIRDADSVYQRHRQQFEITNPWDGLFGSITDFEIIERSFMRLMQRCSRGLESWILDHLDELVTDETGAPIDLRYTGTVVSHHANGQIKESLEVRRGKPHGAFHEFFDDGSLRDSKFYKSGKLSGDYWPNGQVKRVETKQANHRVIEWFYPSGVLQKRYIKDKDGFAVGPIRLFHENGSLAEELHTVKGNKKGPWIKFFADGSPELLAKYSAGEKLIVTNAWNQNREQIVTNGTGIFREYPVDIDWEYELFFEKGWIRESELKDGVPHGKVTTYNNGVLWSVAHFVAGKPNGESTLYWDNGRVRTVTKIAAGKRRKTQEFPKFDYPLPRVVLSLEADERLYTAWRHIQVDEYPQVRNLEEIQQELKVPSFLREVHERNLNGKLKDDYENCNTFNDGIAYFLTVDDSGKVTDVRANGSGVYSGGDWDTYLPLLRKLRFSPGQIRGRAIECRVVARVDHTFVESKIE